MEEFHKTAMGKVFYQRHLPALIEKIGLLTEAYDKNNKLLEQSLILEKKKFNLLNESANASKKE